MKSRIKPSRQMVKYVEQEVYAATVEACEDNNAFFLMALNQEFGFGPERLKRVIHRYNELTEEYSVMRNDGFTFDEINQKMREALASIGIDPDDVYVGKNDFYDAKRRKRYIDKGQEINRKEAEEVKKKFEQFRSLSESAYEKKDLNELIKAKIRKDLNP